MLPSLRKRSFLFKVGFQGLVTTRQEHLTLRLGMFCMRAEAPEAPLTIARSFNCGYEAWNLIRPEGTVEFNSINIAQRN